MSGGKQKKLRKSLTPKQSPNVPLLDVGHGSSGANMRQWWVLRVGFRGLVCRRRFIFLSLACSSTEISDERRLPEPPRLCNFVQTLAAIGTKMLSDKTEKKRKRKRTSLLAKFKRRSITFDKNPVSADGLTTVVPSTNTKRVRTRLPSNLTCALPRLRWDQR